MPIQSSLPIVTICGSMAFYEDMLVYASNLTLDGIIVLMPFITGASGTTKVKLDELHRRKIDLSSKILVVNGQKNGINDYIGESTDSEIKYAIETGKEVEYTHPHNTSTYNHVQQ